jgi:hypothetical protein
MQADPAKLLNLNGKKVVTEKGPLDTGDANRVAPLRPPRRLRIEQILSVTKK